ncbi:MAG: histidine phosphatase family protein, partial [Chlamydiota bacterium]|nr:histidine phosphatase family protein [Chlamydiota bacterium]
MYIYLMRHAHALNIGTDGIHIDFDRKLSTKGKERSKLTGQFLRKNALKIDTILSSPLIRAKETALIMHEVLAVKNPIIETPLLGPGGSKES